MYLNNNVSISKLVWSVFGQIEVVHEDIEPWKLLIGARPGLVRGRLEGAGYEVFDLELPVERNGWVATWEVAQ